MNYIVVLCISLLVTGCGFVPTEVFEVETVSGEIIRLRCPIIPEHKSELTYLYEQECVVVVR